MTRDAKPAGVFLEDARMVAEGAAPAPTSSRRVPARRRTFPYARPDAPGCGEL
ncbi:hypothetical protein ACSNOB_25925 [Micromonospora sp. URMC 106]|uniref:hypothetical protein n=1 Tax=Micromonospora sp. URMC 106 TaxID=3423408 RepID=UPI003F1A745B